MFVVVVVVLLCSALSLYKVDVSVGELCDGQSKVRKLLTLGLRLLVMVRFIPGTSPYHLDLILSPDCTARGSHSL